MGNIAARECSWSLEGASGVLGGGVTGHVDVAHPELGLRDVQLDGYPLAGLLYCVRREAVAASSQMSGRDGGHAWLLSVADAYVRGADLVASYQPSIDWPYSPQIYWRAGALDHFDGLIGSLSLLVSVQTHLLDTFPRIVVASQLATKEVLHIAPPDGGKRVNAESITRECTIQSSMGVCCLVSRLSDAPISYAEFMPASDCQALHVRNSADGNCQVQWMLFAEFLEKGVIRRARLHSAFLPRENDLELAAACCEAIERDSLPLTT